MNALALSQPYLIVSRAMPWQYIRAKNYRIIRFKPSMSLNRNNNHCQLRQRPCCWLGSLNEDWWCDEQCIKSFCKFATTLVDLLFIELIFHLSLIKQMYNQTAHLSQEQIIWVQIVIRRVDFDTDSTVKNYQACSSTQWMLELAVLYNVFLSHQTKSNNVVM